MKKVFSIHVLNSVSFQQIADVVERRMQRPERRVVRRHPRPVKLGVRPDRRHHHPVEREQQPDNEQHEREIEEDPASPARTLDHHQRLHAADVEKLDDDDDEQHREHGERYRRALAQQARADADLIGVGGEELRGVCGSAAGQHVDELEIGEGLDHREQHHDHGDRQQQRPRHVPEALPGPRAVDCGGLLPARG